MELSLSLGEVSPVRSSPCHDKSAPNYTSKELVLELGVGVTGRKEEKGEMKSSPELPVVELSLAPQSLVAPESGNSEASTRGFDVNIVPEEEPATTMADLPSPNSGVSSSQLFSAGSQDIVDNENGGGVRKKLRLSKEQAAFIEDSFKEHNTLNPKRKLSLAKQLNLKPRQVEVWFQNRRARTKLKQTEVDCEYLKRCCETLKQENHRLQREVREIRALQTPFCTKLPAILSLCPSCGNKATSITDSSTTTTTTTVAAPAATRPTSVTQSFSPLFPKSRFNPFAPQSVLMTRQSSATS